MSWDIIAKALFVDNGAAAGLAKFNSQVHEVTKSAPGGSRAFNMMERGLQSLAFQAAGVSGPLGRVAEGMLKFGGGTGLVLGATAGIGLVAGAYKLASAEFEETEKRIDALNERWRTLVAQGKPVVQMLDEIHKASKALADAQERLADMQGRVSANPLLRGAQATGLIGVGGHGTAGERAAAEAEVSALQRGLDQLKQKLVEFGDQAVETATRNANVLEATVAIRGRAITTGQDEAKTLELIAEVTAGASAAAQHLDDTHTAALVTQAIRNARLAEENRALEAQRDVLEDIARIGAEVERFQLSPEALQGIAVPGLKDVLRGDFTKFPSAFDEARLDAAAFFAGGVGKASDKEGIEAIRKRPGVDAAAIASSSVAFLGAVRQGGAPGILGAAGGVALSAGLGPVGIGLNIASGFIGLFNHDAERRHREAMAEWTRIRENTEHRGAPERTSITILVNGKEVSGAILDDVMYGIRRAERRNAVPVLPGS